VLQRSLLYIWWREEEGRKEAKGCTWIYPSNTYVTMKSDNFNKENNFDKENTNHHPKTETSPRTLRPQGYSRDQKKRNKQNYQTKKTKKITKVSSRKL